MKNQSKGKPVRKAYESPKVVVYGNVSELTQGGKKKGGGGNGRGKGRGKGRGHGGSRS
jgi:hypothetical protein